MTDISKAASSNGTSGTLGADDFSADAADGARADLRTPTTIAYEHARLPDLRDVGRLVELAGADPWDVAARLAAGEPGQIGQLANQFRHAASLSADAAAQASAGRRAVVSGYTSNDTSPVEDDQQLSRTVTNLGAQTDQLHWLAKTVDDIGTHLGQAQTSTTNEIIALNQDLSAIARRWRELAGPNSSLSPQVKAAVSRLAIERAVSAIRIRGHTVNDVLAGYEQHLDSATRQLAGAGYHPASPPLQIPGGEIAHPIREPDSIPRPPTAGEAVDLKAVDDRAQAPRGSTWATVRSPRDGTYDSLWRIAQRYLGDGERWPEIWHLNRNSLQPGGRRLTRPSQIRPGWKLRIPHHQSIPTRSPSVPTSHDRPTELPHRQHERPGPRHSHEAGTGTGPASDPRTRAGTHAAHHAHQAHTGTRSVPYESAAPRSNTTGGMGLTTSDGIAVGIGTAALGTAATASAIALRRHYRPGSGERDDLADWYQAQAQSNTGVDNTHTFGGRAPEPSPTPAPDQPPSVKAPFATKTLDRAARDASTPPKIQATDVSGLHALRPIELTDRRAARALVRDALTRDSGADVIVAGPDLHEVLARLGVDTAENTHLTETLDEALDDLDTLIAYRARTINTLPARSSPRPVLLIAHRPDDQRRLQTLLELGAQFAVSAALLPSQRHDDPIRQATVAAPGAARDRSGTREPQTSSSTTVQPRAAMQASIPALPPGPTKLRANSEATPEPNAKATAETPRTTETVTAAPLRLRVLGPVRLTHVTVAESSSHISERPVSLGPKKRELLAFLAVHPDGVARDELIDALWPDAPIDRPQNALHATLTRLRADITKIAGLPTAQLIVHDHDRYRLNAQLVDVDLHHLGTAQRRENAGLKIDRDQDRRQLLRAYKDLAADISATWIVVPRESLRRDALDAAVTLAHAASAADPRSALDLLERARDIDPYNEQIYRGIMRLQRRLGRTSAIRQTLAILAAQLRDIDSTPQPATISLADALTNTGTSPERQDSSAAG